MVLSSLIFTAIHIQYDEQTANRVSREVTPGVTVEGTDNHEVWGSVVLTSPVGVKPGVAVKYEQPTTDGADGFGVVVGSLAYGMPLSGVNVAGVGVNLNWTTSVLYNTGVTVGGVDVVKSGVSAWQVGVGSAVQAGRVVVGVAQRAHPGSRLRLLAMMMT